MTEKRTDFDDYAESYNQLMANHLSFFSEDSAYFSAYKIDVIRKTVGMQPKVILEYGCGIGRNLPHLRNAFPDARLLACDVSEESLSIARRDNPSVEIGVPNDLLITDTVDLIVVAGVFHHIPPAERSQVMLDLARSLKRSGNLYVFEHNPYNPVTRRLVATCPFDEDAILLRPKETASLARSSGLSLKMMKYVLFFPEVLQRLRPLEKWLGWLPLGGQYVVCAERP